MVDESASWLIRDWLFWLQALSSSNAYERASFGKVGPVAVAFVPPLDSGVGLSLFGAPPIAPELPDGLLPGSAVPPSLPQADRSNAAMATVAARTARRRGLVARLPEERSSPTEGLRPSGAVAMTNHSSGHRQCHRR